MSIAMQLYRETQGANQYADIQKKANLYEPTITDGKHGEIVYTFTDKSQFFLCDRGYEQVVQVLLF